MNYVGVAIAGLSGLFYVFVKTQVKTFPSNESIKEEIAVREELKPAVKRIIGICLAVFSGNLHGILGRAFRKFKPTLGGLKLKMFACSSLFLGCVQFHQRN